MPNYDYIIIGAGASGLLLADAMGKDSFFSKKSILLIDKDEKKTNDRTWCFWEQGKGEFDPISHKIWNKVFFAGEKLRQSYNIAPYQYKMIQGLDFYEHYLAQLKGYSNITSVHEEVIAIEQKENQALLKTNKNLYSATQVFNSIFDYNNFKNPKYPILQQHFVGWFVKTENSIFKTDEATFMDFSVPQKGNTRFMYVLPFSANKALVEYTLFSSNPLPKKEYEDAIIDYLKKSNSGKYEITDTEQGNIPMTCYNFDKHNSENIFHIGTAGGWAKASTGYTFKSTSQKVKKLVDHIKKRQKPITFKTKNRFWYYDLLLLDILNKNNGLGRSIFESLFQKKNPQLVFKFLDEETSILEDIKIMMAPKPFPFIQALIKRIF